MTTRLSLPLGLFLALLVSGCYWDRLTHNYDSAIELNNEDSNNAIMEESGRDAETLARNEKRLKELASDEEPVYKMITEGYSVVSKERLQPVIDWYENR